MSVLHTAPVRKWNKCQDCNNCSQKLMQKENRLKNLSLLSRDRKACCPQEAASEGDGVQVADIILSHIKQEWLPNWISFCWQKDIVQKWAIPPSCPCSRWHSVRWTNTNINVKSGTDTSCNFHLSRHLGSKFWRYCLREQKMRCILIS